VHHLDIYNYVVDHLTEAVPVLSDEQVDSDFKKIDPVPCPTFRELCKVYENNLEFTKDIRQCLTTMLAVVLSNGVQGGQLGLRVIGPPGSFKSTLAEALSHCEKYVYPRSKFTGIVSGHDQAEKMAQQMAHKLRGKTIIVKDADPFLQLTNRHQVESEIRDVLGDGVIRVEYRNGKQFEIQTDFNFIMCGTKALRGMDDALLGSRFLDILIHEEGSDTSSIVNRAMDSQFEAITSSFQEEDDEDDVQLKKLIPQLAGSTSGFILHKKEQVRYLNRVRPPTAKQRRQIQAMAQLIGIVRNRLDKGRNLEIKYRPEGELPTRLSEQLLRLGIFLALTLDNRQEPKEIVISKAVMDILTKIMCDTAYSFQFDIIRALHREAPRCKEEIASEIDVSITQTYNLLQEMQTLRMVNREAKSNPHGKGRKGHFYDLTPQLKKLCKEVL